MLLDQRITLYYLTTSLYLDLIQNSGSTRYWIVGRQKSTAKRILAVRNVNRVKSSPNAAALGQFGVISGRLGVRVRVGVGVRDTLTPSFHDV